MKELLGIRATKTVRQIVMIGRPLSRNDRRPSGPPRGRRPVSELVSYERWGERRP